MPPSAGACQTIDAALNPDCGRAGPRSSTMTAIGWRRAAAGVTSWPVSGAGTSTGDGLGVGVGSGVGDGEALAETGTDGDADGDGAGDGGDEPSPATRPEPAGEDDGPPGRAAFAASIPSPSPPRMASTARAGTTTRLTADWFI
jgi:hypothetical protein